MRMKFIFQQKESLQDVSSLFDCPLISMDFLLADYVAHHNGQNQNDHDGNQREGIDFWARAAPFVFYMLHTAADAVRGSFPAVVMSAVIHMASALLCFVIIACVF
jgi:hypothetical protein